MFVILDIWYDIGICDCLEQKQRDGWVWFLAEVCNLLRDSWGRLHTFAKKYTHPSCCFCSKRSHILCHMYKNNTIFFKFLLCPLIYIIYESFYLLANWNILITLGLMGKRGGRGLIAKVYVIHCQSVQFATPKRLVLLNDSTNLFCIKIRTKTWLTST